MHWAGMRLSTREALKRGSLPPSMSSNGIILVFCTLYSNGSSSVTAGMTRCWLCPVWTLTLLYLSQPSWCSRDECPQAHNSSRLNTKVIICYDNFIYSNFFRQNPDLNSHIWAELDMVLVLNLRNWHHNVRAHVRVTLCTVHPGCIWIFLWLWKNIETEKRENLCTEMHETGTGVTWMSWWRCMCEADVVYTKYFMI